MGQYLLTRQDFRHVYLIICTQARYHLIYSRNKCDVGKISGVVVSVLSSMISKEVFQSQLGDVATSACAKFDYDF